MWKGAYMDRYSEDVEMWAEAVENGEADMDSAIMELKRLGYTREEAMDTIIRIIIKTDKND